MLTFGNFELR